MCGFGELGDCYGVVLGAFVVPGCGAGQFGWSLSFRDLIIGFV